MRASVHLFSRFMYETYDHILINFSVNLTRTIIHQGYVI